MEREAHTGARGCLKEAVTQWGGHTGAGSCQDLRAHEERSPHRSRFAGRACDPLGDPHWSSLFLKAGTPWEGPMLGQFVKSYSPWEGLMLEKFMENVSCERNPMLEQGKSVGSLPPEGQGAAETTCDELTITPIPHPLMPLGERRQRSGSEAEPGQKGGVGGRCFKIWIYFLTILLFFSIVDELNSLFSPSLVCFACDGNW